MRSPSVQGWETTTHVHHDSIFVATFVYVQPSGIGAKGTTWHPNAFISAHSLKHQASHQATVVSRIKTTTKHTS